MRKYLFYIVTALFIVGCQSGSEKKGSEANNGTHKHADGKEHSHAKENKEGDKHEHKNGEGHKHADGTEHAHKKASTDCRHCGMTSTEFPKWKVKVVAKAGEVWYCSPRCMFISTLNKEKAPKEIASIEAVEYYNTKPVDAKTAFYVTGSDILGPMGHDLVPLKDKAAANDFKNEHKGAKIYTFAEVNMETVKALVNKK